MDTKHNNKEYKLVKIYCYVCEKFENGLQFQCERFRNNKQPKLANQEIKDHKKKGGDYVINTELLTKNSFVCV